MTKRDDGNEQDLRIRNDLDAKPLDDDNPFTGTIPEGKDPCVDGHGDQTDIPPPEPEPGDEILYNWADISEVCPDGFSIDTLDLFMIRLMKNHFSSADKIFDPELKSLVFSEDSGETGIRIVFNTNWDAENVGFLPAIIVKRLRQRSPQHSVIGDRGETSDLAAGTERFVRHYQGGHRFLVMGETDAQTEAIAKELHFFLTCFSPIFRSELPFHDFQVTDLGELGLLDGTGNTFAVPVQVVYAYEFAWTIQRTRRDLRGVRISLTTNLSSDPTRS